MTAPYGADIFNDEVLMEYVAWNAPDYDYVRRVLRQRFEEVLEEAIEAHRSLYVSSSGEKEA